MRIERFAFENLWDFTQDAPPVQGGAGASSKFNAVHSSPLQDTILDSEPVEAEPQGPKFEFTQEEMQFAKDQAKLQGFAEGKKAGHEEAQQQYSLAQMASAKELEKLIDQLEQLRLTHSQHMQSHSKTLAELVVVTARHIVSEALVKMPTAPIEQMLRQCYPLFMEEPVVEITVAETQHSVMEQSITGFLQEKGYKGRVVVQGDQALAAGDTKIDWGKASVERDVEMLWEQVSMALRSMPLNLD